MRHSSLKLCLFAIATSAFSLTANAQLDDFVNNPDNGASDLQQATGNAVQRTCGALFAAGGFQLTGPEGDLFERCNEMVQTAADLQGDTGRLRSLNISGPELLAAIQNVSGEELHAQNTLSTRVTNGQFSNIAGRLNAVRIGGNSAALGGRVAATGTYDDPSRNMPGYQDLSLGSSVLTGGAAAGDEDMAGSRWGWFLEGSFNAGDRDETASEDGFDFDATSVTLGVDYLLNNGVIGVSVGIDNYEADFNPSPVVNGGNVEVEGTTGAIFGALFRGNWYFDGILSFGSLDSSTDRDAFYISNNPACLPAPCPGVNTTLSGQTDGDFVAGGLSLGYDYTNGNWDITPQLSLAFRDVSLDGYVESDPLGGGLSLAYDKQQIDSLKSILGVAFTGNFSRDFGILSPQFRLEWHHEFEDDPARLMAKYAVENQLAAQGVVGAAGAGVFSTNAANCISCFQITGDQIDPDFGVISAGLSAVFSQRIQVYGVVESVVALDHLTSTGISVGVRGQF
ncbi:MAG: autotransporter outer membrane beta-barrel domain-containing protein [Woeseiaceae bacterium]